MNVITFLFLCLMLMIFMSGVLLSWFNKKNTFGDFIQYIPSALTSIGILGTFTGIVIGLRSFNLDQIDLSIASLLEGLKTAFITSIFGILLSIVFRMIGYVLPKPDSAYQPASQKTIDDLYHVLEKSLVFQQTNQTMINQQNEKQHTFLQEFNQDFSEKFTHAIVTKLNDLVGSFNENLTVQFGDNLQQFSASFKQVETVFVNAKAQIEKQQQVLDLHQKKWETAQTHFDTFESVIESVNLGINKLAQTYETLTPMYDNQMNQFKIIQSDSEKFSATLTKLDSVLPDMGDKISSLEKCLSLLSTDLTQNLLKYQKDFQVQTIQQSELFEANIKQWTGSVEKTQRDFVIANDALEGFIEHTQNIKSTSFEKIANLNIEQFEKNLEQNSILQQQLHEKISEGLNQSLEQQLHMANGFSAKQHDKIEELLQRELDAVFSQMGDALGEISGQFTRDYQLLIQQMQQVLNKNQALLK
ncbi:MotA/TolQ/ExbB proton channel family protein [Marinicellulosiphila megalodicopiae]|uniref:MotA/TolQ/ExbB proton channel family protein n=1 Tax=Marinicellulosiphila megalodicopiae TaxID=2724896 RepID=UPI003BAF2979